MSKIRDLRNQAGMTRAELSRRSGVSIRTIEDWEYGKSKPTDFSPLSKVAKALDCSIEDLI